MQSKHAAIISGSVIFSSIVVAWAFKTSTPHITVTPDIELPTRIPGGDHCASKTYEQMTMYRAGKAVVCEAGKGEYRFYEGFYPMATSTGHIKVNLVRSGQAMNDYGIDHIFVSTPVEFREHANTEPEPAANADQPRP